MPQHAAFVHHLSEEVGKIALVAPDGASTITSNGCAQFWATEARTPMRCSKSYHWSAVIVRLLAHKLARRGLCGAVSGLLAVVHGCIRRASVVAGGRPLPCCEVGGSTRPPTAVPRLPRVDAARFVQPAEQQ